jgi:hypothetical protein
MATCYADHVQFQDEVFTLNGKAESVGMWTMLCSATAGNPASKAAWHLEFSGVKADTRTGQALGIPGLLMGWTPFLRAKVQTTANENLQKFLAKK